MLIVSVACVVQVNARIEYVDLIIYHKPGSLRNLLKFRLTTLKRMGIWVNYGLENLCYYMPLIIDITVTVVYLSIFLNLLDSCNSRHPVVFIIHYGNQPPIRAFLQHVASH
jgi:hypothetical protein